MAKTTPQACNYRSGGECVAQCPASSLPDSISYMCVSAEASVVQSLVEFTGVAEAEFDAAVVTAIKARLDAAFGGLDVFIVIGSPQAVADSATLQASLSVSTDLTAGDGEDATEVARLFLSGAAAAAMVQGLEDAGLTGASVAFAKGASIVNWVATAGGGELRSDLYEPPVEETQEPTQTPTDEPTTAPTEEPTQTPTDKPSTAPTEEPTAEVTQEPTEEPTQEDTQASGTPYIGWYGQLRRPAVDTL